jgi:hypothetical protein
MKRLLAGVGSAVLAAAALHAAVVAARGGGPKSVPLADEQAGRIRSISIQFAPSALFAEPAWRDLFRHLPADVQVTVAVEKREDFDAFVRLTGRRSAVPVVVGRPITSWARDRFVALSDGTIVRPPEPHPGGPERRNDWHVPPAVARALGVRCVDAPFRFDGGDFCRAYGRVFASDTWLRRNPERAPDELRRLARGLFGEEVVVLEGAPEHHVGMVFAPAGGNRFVVGDARLGASLAPASVDADRSEETAARYDAVARQLADLGYEVVRLPVVPTKRDFAWLTFTNAVLEEGTVYLPAFGMQGLDGEAEHVYRELGFEVKPVDVSRCWELGGTLHCLVHVLRR